MSNFDKFFSDVSSGYWWTTVVLVGLLLNLTSAYLKPYLDRWYERRVETAQSKRIKANDNYEIEVSLLAANHGLLLVKGFDEMRWRLQTLVFALFAFALLTAAAFYQQGVLATNHYGPLLYGGVRLVALFCIVLGLWSHARAMQSSTMVHGARVSIFKALLKDRPATD